MVKLLDGFVSIQYKWIFKTKRDFKGNIDQYKFRLVAKEFTQREGIDYNETFSPMSKKDSFKILMTLITHFDLELHQMDVKIAWWRNSYETNRRFWGKRERTTSVQV